MRRPQPGGPSGRSGRTDDADRRALVATAPLLAGTRAGAVISVVVFGPGLGVAGLATPALLAERYGATAYASIAGRLAASVTVVKAVAPVAAATALGNPAGYPLLLAVVATCCAVAAAGLLARAGPGPRHRPRWRAFAPAGGG
ncbi:hypothetical protein [Micromonospora halophytica]|uniref:Uncharacterized protein n=1 Tax=Micromonospora halophytica TaxID=47864 RepID=A0A1C5HUR6_9ACTN|nr:hypothetical protein [Micromonospora halophytica]SCG49750.1 hypothetical protein GA0070560_10672 [Micromonospora halophytica]